MTPRERWRFARQTLLVVAASLGAVWAGVHLAFWIAGLFID